MNTNATERSLVLTKELSGMIAGVAAASDVAFDDAGRELRSVLETLLPGIGSHGNQD